MAQGTSWLSSVSMAFAQTRHAWKAVNNPVASAPPLPATTYMPMSWPGWERWETEYGNGRQNGMDEQRIKLALTSSWVFANVNAVANEASLATLQVVERQRGEQEDKEIVNHDLEVLWEQPNPFMGRSYLMKFWIFNLLLSGRAALFWVPGQGGLAECWPVPSLMLTPIAHPTEFITGYWFQAQPTDKPLKIDRKYITWSRLVHPFDLRDGLSPLAAIFEAIEADLFMRRWNKSFFGKENAAPTGLISVPKDMLDPDIARVRQEIVEFFGGSGNRRVAVARAGDLEWKPFDRSQKDMEFLQGREFSRNEIDRAFGFPEGYWSAAASRANAESAVARMIENAVWPHLVMLSEDMNAQTMPVWYGKQYRAMFEDIRPRNRALEMQEMGVAQATLTIDEIRKKYWKLESIGDDRGKLLVAEVGKGAPPEPPGGAEMPPAELPEAPEPDDGMPPESGEQPTDADQLAPVPDALDVKARDLERWQIKALKALKAGKAPNVRFTPEALTTEDAAAIRAALMGARTPQEVRACFIKKAPDTLTPAERALIARIAAVLQAGSDTIAAAVARGESPSLDQLSAALAAILVEALTAQYSATAMRYGADVATQGAAWAAQYTPDVIAGVNDTTMTLVQQVITEARATPGMTLADIAARLAPAFGPARADVIATTELTRAAAQATRASQEYLRGNGVDMVMVWRTNHDERVCPICNPRDGLTQGDGWENPPPAHPRCRCSVTLTRRGL